MLSGQFDTRSEAETTALGARLAVSLPRGTVVLLFGDLGAGKTAFVRGLAEGLGVDPDEVSSPTFTLIQRYAGRVPLYHVDLYRIESGAEVEDLGLDELAAEGAIVAIEWAERWPRRPSGASEVHLQDLGDDRRRVVITPADDAGA